MAPIYQSSEIGEEASSKKKMALDIPKENTVSITTIKTLSRASVERFIAALKSAPPVSNSQEMAERIAKQVPSIPIEQMISVLDTLYMLYYIRELSGVKPNRFLEDLLEGIRRSPHLQLSQKDLSNLRSLLEKLMSIDTLKTVSKAARLQRDGERLYCEGKILSDIRPVFGPDPAAQPVGAVLTHTLRIGYHEGSSHKEFHIILDSEDLMALNNVVRRAQAKDKTIRDLLKGMKLPNLGE